MTSDDDLDEIGEEWYARKTAWMEETLGKEHDMVMHAIIPYSIGGGLDLYYFPNGMAGTAIATKELCELPDEEGSSNSNWRWYELVMFTRHSLNLANAHDGNTPFGRAHATINAILNCIAPYSATAELLPHQTCEFPAEMDSIGGKCLIFDEIGAHQDASGDTFGLLGIIEVFRSEMEFAQENGGAELIRRLKIKGHYPYSDLDREAVA